jgi:SNF2 family DNA or RNA helicase
MYWEPPKVKHRFLPFKHQIDGIEFLTLHKRCALLLDMGLGKSYTTLAAAHWLMDQGYIKSVLILAPLSTLKTTWAEEMFSSFVSQGRSYTILHGTADRRADMLEAGADFYIANHHILKVAVKKKTNKSGVEEYVIQDKFKKLAEVDLIVFDESSELSNAQTHTYKALCKLLRPETRLWECSGAPTPSGPQAAWSQAKLINPNNVPKYFGQWRKMVCNEIKIGQFSKWVPKANADQLVYKALQPAMVVRKRDAVDLPPVTVERRFVEMTPDQDKAFKKMLHEMYMESADGEKVLANNASHRMLMLRQIAAGSVKANEEFHKVDCQHRIEAIKEVIEHCGGKVVIFVPFLGILNLIRDELSVWLKKHHNSYCEVIYGDVASKERDRILADFNAKGCGPRALICQINSVSHGVQMQGDCSTAIYAAPPTGNGAYRQSLARLDRVGQQNNVLIVQLVSCKMEEKLFDKLDQDEDFQQALLEMYKQAQNGEMT